MAVILGSLWRLWVREFFDESGAHALRLVKLVATLWTAVAGDLDFPVWIRSNSPLRIVSRFPARSSTVRPRLLVVVLARRGRRLSTVGLVFTRWCMRSFVPPELGSEALILLAEFFDFFLQISKLFEKLFFGRLRRHEQARRDGLQFGDHPSKMHSFARCIDLLHQLCDSYECLPKSLWG
ncbi:hypothetical protein C492_08010 [Natronococcus jeotgali DSM 18795]|uniref:Uncharacterized protein n=1 Tax=Natronococcus jeotgali DSM 18795 TaxID=1227498 RepID=L9XL80_9EURY|nr:hypothetical protein C492_08010 [Natronococcus jeotgali DSM 18795]